MATTPTSRNQITVYFLAAPEDEAVCEAIREYLTPVIRGSEIPIRVESDFEIEGGEVIADQEQRLLHADIVLALISADFINDDRIYERNQRVIQRHNDGQTVMIPILVRNCLWKLTPFGKPPLLPKLLPRNVQPLNNKQYWNSVDDALTAVVEDIYASIANISIAMPTRGPDGDSQVADSVAPTVVPPEAAPESEPGPAPSEATLTRPLAPPGLPPSPPTPPAGPPTSTATLPVTETVDANWRKDYYRRVMWKRGAALFLDVLFLFFGPFIVVSIVLAIADAESEWIFDLAGALLLILSAIIFYVINPVFESSRMKGTLGKRIMKIEITEQDGDQISYVRAFVRNILRTLVLISYCFIVPLVIQISTFRKNKKLFHDQLSSTVIGEKLRS